MNLHSLLITPSVFSAWLLSTVSADRTFSDQELYKIQEFEYSDTIITPTSTTSLSLLQSTFQAECITAIESYARDKLISQHEIAIFLQQYCIKHEICEADYTISFNALSPYLQIAFARFVCKDNQDCRTQVENGSQDLGYTIDHNEGSSSDVYAYQERVDDLCQSLYTHGDMFHGGNVSNGGKSIEPPLSNDSLVVLATLAIMCMTVIMLFLSKKRNERKEGQNRSKQSDIDDMQEEPHSQNGRSDDMNVDIESVPLQLSSSGESQESGSSVIQAKSLMSGNLFEEEEETF